MKGKYDRFEPFDPESGLDRCPWCGNTITGDIVCRDVRGRRGLPVQLAPFSAAVRVYHERCYLKREVFRRRVENSHLGRFTADDGGAPEGVAP